MLVGLDVQTEYRTSDGRIDLFVKTDRFYYIIELKIDRRAREALGFWQASRERTKRRR